MYRKIDEKKGIWQEKWSSPLKGKQTYITQNCCTETEASSFPLDDVTVALMTQLEILSGLWFGPHPNVTTGLEGTTIPFSLS